MKTLQQKIQHVIYLLSNNNEDIIAIPTKYKSAVKIITKNKMFGYELNHIEDLIDTGKCKSTYRQWVVKTSFYQVTKN